MRKLKLINPTITIAICLLGTQLAMAQDGGQLKGRVADSSGGAIDKAIIFIESSTTKYEVAVDEWGRYSTELPAGNYRVSTNKIPGFVPYKRDDVSVENGKITEINIIPEITFDDAECILYVLPSRKKLSKKPAVSNNAMPRTRRRRAFHQH